MSTTTTTEEQLFVFPQASVAVHKTFVCPIGKLAVGFSEFVKSLVREIIASQSSDVAGNSSVTVAKQLSGKVATSIAAGHCMVGGAPS